MQRTPFLVGIDLGTTNSTVAAIDTRRPSRVEIVPILQLTAPAVVEARLALPSFLYFGDAHEIASGQLALPWNVKTESAIGIFARDHGALTPTRQVASAKSWLVHAGVDRRARLLPWGTDPSDARLSAVEASAACVAHIRNAWNATVAAGDGSLRLERQSVVLTVPASFDEEARELTVEAARAAGLTNLTLLEEPMAAFYAWTATHDPAALAGDRETVALVCDVGGGTTDFSLIRIRIEDGEPSFERIAIGDHLLLGGDNVDLALALVVEQKITASHPGIRLALTQRQALRRQCSEAKERLLAEAAPGHVTVTLLGAGRAVVGGAIRTELTRGEVDRTLETFLPITAPGDVDVVRTARAGLRELGLPYETDTAVTRHLAAFLARSAGVLDADHRAVVQVRGRAMIRPDRVLFNGGFFTPAVARRRIEHALTEWFGSPPEVLPSSSLDAAVALGAARYAQIRAGLAPMASLVKAGSAHAYYIALSARHLDDPIRAVCVLARGTDEGTHFTIEHPFTVATNTAVAFALYSATMRRDAVGQIVTVNANDLYEHAPLITVLRYGRKSRGVEIPVGLSVAFTEVGTLELWCESQVSDHRWRLQFQLRGSAATVRLTASAKASASHAEAPGSTEARKRKPDTTGDVDGESIRALEDYAAGDALDAAPEHEAVVAEDAIAHGEAAVRAVFAEGTDAGAEQLVAILEQMFGYAKSAWPIRALRQLSDVLIDVADRRRVSPRLEARWLNLFGFCLRPGFGAAKDPWRITEARKIYAAGVVFPSAIQNRAEWMVLWQRVAGGFSTGQQLELARRTMSDLGVGAKKARGLTPQIERESWRLLASLERVDAPTRVKIGDELLARVERDSTNASLLWAVGRLGARVPLYGPLNSVVPPRDAERWLRRLAWLKRLTADVAAALVHLGALTGDPLRDVDQETLAAVSERLANAGIDVAATRPLREVLPTSTADAAWVFGEPLPNGLRLGDTSSVA